MDSINPLIPNLVLAESQFGEILSWFGRGVAWLRDEIADCISKICATIINFFQYCCNLLSTSENPRQANTAVRSAEIFINPDSNGQNESNFDAAKAFQVPQIVNPPDVTAYVYPFLRRVKMENFFKSKEQLFQFYGERLISFQLDGIGRKLEPEEILKVISFFPNLKKLALAGAILSEKNIKDLTKLVPKLEFLVMLAHPQEFSTIAKFRKLTSLIVNLDYKCCCCDYEMRDQVFNKRNTQKKLEILQIYGKITNVVIDQLKLFPNLKCIELSYKNYIRNSYQITDLPISIKKLESLHHLEVIKLTGFKNLISHSEIQELRQSRPNLVIQV